MCNEEIVGLIQAGDASLMGVLYEQNKPLIKQIARRICDSDTEDAMQDAYFGLYAAVQGYDRAAGALFMTYAAYHIRTAINRGKSEIKRVPECVRLKAHRINRAQEELTQKIGRSPTMAELSAYVGVAVQDIEYILKAVEPPQSIETPLIEDMTLADIIPDKAVDVEGEAIKAVQADMVRSILDELPPDERKAAVFSFIRGYSCRKTAALLHMPERDTRRLLNSAARYLRKPRIYNMLAGTREL